MTSQLAIKGPLFIFVFFDGLSSEWSFFFFVKHGFLRLLSICMYGYCSEECKQLFRCYVQFYSYLPYYKLFYFIFQEVEVEGKLLRAGKSVGVVSVDFMKKRTGKLIAQTCHTK
jgi:acyl-coenzyme A thioesterase 13